MNIRSRKLYAQMMEEIGQAESCCATELTRVEKSFSIALIFCEKIKMIAGSYLFFTESEEIEFFKYIQPLFIARMEYYMLIYQAILFKPAHDKDDIIRFWMGQLKRIESFQLRHREFYTYYTHGQTDKDADYFKQGANITATKSRRYFYTRRSFLPGQLAGMLLGFCQYRTYIDTELKNLYETVPMNFSTPELACA